MRPYQIGDSKTEREKRGVMRNFALCSPSKERAMQILFARVWILVFLTLPGWLGAMSVDEARHLLTRTGFGASVDEMNSLLPLTRKQAVNRLVSRTHTHAKTPAPDWLNEYRSVDRSFFRRMRNEKSEESQKMRQYFQHQQRLHGQELKAWWVREMLATDSPFTEKMTLFWSNHFTSSLRKIKSPLLMYNQNLLLRKYALGNFARMVHAVAKDPAMIVYLDNQSNHKGKPNENFARELLELFTLGEGHYTEQDIKQAARAFTGWMTKRHQGKYFFNKRQHDYGNKIFLGHQGPFNGNEIIDIVLQQDQLAIHIIDKLWKEFISPEPDSREVNRLAADFRRSGYEIKPLMRALLKSDHFWSPENRGVLVKSPIELLVGTLRTFSVSLDNPLLVVTHTRLLGQDIMDPPNVKGWPGGTLWIDSNTLLLRNQILQGLSSPSRQSVPARRTEMMRQREQQAREMMAGIKKDSHGVPLDLDQAMQAQRMAMQSARQMQMHSSVSIDRESYLKKIGRSNTEPLSVYLLPLSAVRVMDDEHDATMILADILMDPTYQLK